MEGVGDGKGEEEEGGGKRGEEEGKGGRGSMQLDYERLIPPSFSLPFLTCRCC